MLKIKVGDRIHWSSIRSGTIVKVDPHYKILGVSWDTALARIKYSNMCFSELEKYTQLGLATLEEK